MSSMTYPKLTLPQLLDQTAANFPDRTALIYFGAKITYAQLLQHVNRMAAALQGLGLKQGDRVALLLPNCPQFVIGYFGALRAGAIVTATSSMYTPREVAHQWNDAGATIVITDRRLYPVIQAAQSQLKTVRHVILTGIRQYSPRHFTQLCQSLEGTAEGKRSPGAKAGSTSSGEAAPPTVHEWKDFLKVAASP